MTDQKSILIVDDDKPFRELYRERLTLAGYKVDEATTGQEALAKVKRNPHYAAILLDILMPEMSGLAALEKLKSAPQTQDIPIVIFTAMGRGSTEGWAREAKADVYLTKVEVVPRDVVNQLEEAIKKARNKQ